MGFNSGFKGLIQIIHQPDATIFQFIILTKKLLHQVGDLFELYEDARTYKP
jgi:hypothetical protein